VRPPCGGKGGKKVIEIARSCRFLPCSLLSKEQMVDRCFRFSSAKRFGQIREAQVCIWKAEKRPTRHVIGRWYVATRARLNVPLKCDRTAQRSRQRRSEDALATPLPVAGVLQEARGHAARKHTLAEQRCIPPHQKRSITPSIAERPDPWNRTRLPFMVQEEDILESQRPALRKRAQEPLLFQVPGAASTALLPAAHRRPRSAR
jgi:hypothetical protein